MTNVRKNKKKLNEKLKQVYKELNIEAQDKASKAPPSDTIGSGAPIEVASKGSLTVVQMKDTEETKKDETNTEKLQKSMDNLASKLTGIQLDKNGNPVTEGKQGSFMARGLKDYAKSKLDQVKQATSAEGLAGLVGINPGSGIAGSVLGAYMVKRDEKKERLAAEQEYISNFGSLTEGGRALSKEEQQIKGKELYAKETANKTALEEIEERAKIARVFGGSLSKDDVSKKKAIERALREVAMVKSGGKSILDEDAPMKKSRASNADLDAMDIEETTIKVVDKEFEKERAELIKEVMRGIDDGVANASQEEKANIFEKGGKDYIAGVKSGVMEELLKLTKEQLEELKRISAISADDIEEKEIKKVEETQTKVLQEISTKLTTTEEDRLEKKIGPGGAFSKDASKDPKKKEVGILDGIMGMFESLKGIGQVGKALGPLMRALGPLAAALGSIVGPALLLGTTFVAAYKVGEWLNNKLLTNKDGSNRIVDAADSLGIGPTIKSPDEAQNIQERKQVEYEKSQGKMTKYGASLAKKHKMDVGDLPVLAAGSPEESLLRENARITGQNAIAKMQTGGVEKPLLKAPTLAQRALVPVNSVVAEGVVGSVVPVTAVAAVETTSGERAVVPAREALSATMREREAIQESLVAKKDEVAKTVVSNSNNTSTVVNNSTTAGGKSSSRPADDINQDRYKFLQRRLVF